mgnify:CR=1 FL=1|tara:strand:+ start:21246 stop:21425 length:180 start_codon:yes stop_codon:yes gene_type:complete
MSLFNCDPDEELYDDDSHHADEEYPRNEKSVLDNIEFLDQFFSYYENYARKEVEDEMGS